jgi:hypothetical protein
MAQKAPIKRADFLVRTLDHLKNRPRTLTLQTISEDTGLPIGWLWSIINNDEADPSVSRIVALYEYLTKSKLEFR